MFLVIKCRIQMNELILTLLLHNMLLLDGNFINCPSNLETMTQLRQGSDCTVHIEILDEFIFGLGTRIMSCISDYDLIILSCITVHQVVAHRDYIWLKSRNPRGVGALKPSDQQPKKWVVSSWMHLRMVTKVGLHFLWLFEISISIVLC